MKKFRSSRGWRNNNPLNIRRGENWVGLVEKPTDWVFCQFYSMAMGYRAAYKILKSYYRYFNQSGMAMTIENIISRWAPERENDTDEYIYRVESLMFFGRGLPIYPGLSAVQDERVGRLMAAMTCVECGCQPQDVDCAAIAKGILLAGGHEVDPESLRI